MKRSPKTTEPKQGSFASSLFRFSLLLLICASACADDDAGDPQAPLLTGSGGNSQSPFTVESHVVSGQVIDIYVPPGYSSATALPIIYFNDGDIFPDVFEVLTTDFPEPFIMVGLHAGRDRMSKYIPYEDQWITDNWGAYTPNARRYTETLVEEVIPFVEERFAVDASRRAIFGMSLGGLHATWAGINYPDYFSFVGALSPSYWVADYEIIRRGANTLSEANRFYFDIGTLEWNYYVPFIQTLKDAGLTYGESIFYHEVYEGLHNRGSWGARVHIPFLLFLEGHTEGAVSYEVIQECIRSLSTPGLFFQRLNPLIKYESGIVYSLTTECKYEVVGGTGEVTIDGRYQVDGNEMEVQVRFDSWRENLEVSNCN